MAHAEKCPVCGGSGKLPYDGNTTAPIHQTCHGCGGKGWVTIQDPYTPYTPPTPMPQDPPWKGPWVADKDESKWTLSCGDPFGTTTIEAPRYEYVYRG